MKTYKLESAGGEFFKASDGSEVNYPYMAKQMGSTWGVVRFDEVVMADTGWREIDAVLLADALNDAYEQGFEACLLGRNGKG